MGFNGISNDIQVEWNWNIYIKFFLILEFCMNLFEIDFQDCQNKWLSIYPHP
jgi:hypothetical protein